jgi:hypothetical protein
MICLIFVYRCRIKAFLNQDVNIMNMLKSISKSLFWRLFDLKPNYTNDANYFCDLI